MPRGVSRFDEMILQQDIPLIGQKVINLPVENDPHFNNVSLLLHGGGANNSIFIFDNSQIQKKTNVFGNTKIIDDSIYFDGTSDYLTIDDSPGFVFGSGDYTIELWANITSASNYGGLFTKGPLGVVNNSVYSLEFNNTSNAISFFVGNVPPDGAYIVAGTTNVRTSATWTHIAVSRVGNNTRLFINGTQEGSTYTSSYTISSGNSVHIGGGFYSPTTNNINGYLRDIRITKGVGRYASNFSRPLFAFPDF